MLTKNAREWSDLYVKEVIQKYNPKFKIRFKSESKIFKVLSPLIKLINPTFFTGFITTIFGVMWVPDDFFDRPVRAVLQTCAHEGRHEYDRDRLPFGVFELMYTFPQNLFIPFLVLACLSSCWWWLAIAIVFLAPLPSPWRYDLEMNGYAMSRIWNVHVYGHAEGTSDEHVVHNLSSLQTYYATWPFKDWIYKDLTKPLNINRDPGFKDPVDFLRRYGFKKTEN